MDDSNRIIIPQGNFKFYFITDPDVQIKLSSMSHFPDASNENIGLQASAGEQRSVSPADSTDSTSTITTPYGSPVPTGSHS